MLLRHIPQSLYRMRSVGREMRDAGAGWGAFSVIMLGVALMVAAELLLRDLIIPPAEALLTDGDVLGSAPALIGLAIGFFALAGFILTVVWWAACRVFGVKATLRQSASGVAAGMLPQFVLSPAIVAIALLLSILLGEAAASRMLDVIDYALLAPLVAYAVLGYGAATGMGLLKTFLVQLVGLIAGTVLLLLVVALAGQVLDKALSALVQLVLG